jgi:hypothetical protein
LPNQQFEPGKRLNIQKSKIKSDPRRSDMAEFNAVEKHYMDRAFQSNFALWSALLTINGVMLSAFSLLRLVVPNVNTTIIVLLVGSCAVSLLLLVYNFFVTKQHYQKTGSRFMSPENVDLSEEQRQKEIHIAIRKHRNAELREFAVLILLIVEVGLVIILLLLAGKK